MLVLLLLILLLWAVLAGLLTAWSVWLQGYLYTEPATGIVWRGPASASGVMAVVLLWVLFDYQAPGRYRPFWESSSTEDAPPFKELRIPRQNSKDEDVYKLMRGTVLEYRLGGQASGKPMPSRPLPYVVAVEGESRATFKPERDDKGNLTQRTQSSWFGGTSKDALRYIDEDGRVMLEGALGRVSRTRGGWFLGNLFLNTVFLAVWFVVLWLVLRFQWPHALGQAVVFWLVLLLFVLPPLLSRVEAVAQERAEQARRAAATTE